MEFAQGESKKTSAARSKITPNRAPGTTVCHQCAMEISEQIHPAIRDGRHQICPDKRPKRKI
jgi:hypothetical protein